MMSSVCGAQLARGRRAARPAAARARSTVCTCSGWAWARASALTAPPLEPSTAAGPASRWVSSRERSSARMLRGRVLVGVVERAAVDAPRVGGEHGVVGGEQVGQRREVRGVHRGADEHHERALARAPRSAAVRRGPRGSPAVTVVGVRSSGSPGAARWCSVAKRDSRRGAESSLVSEAFSHDRGPPHGRRGSRPGPGARRRRRRVHPPRRAAAPGAARPLLPHARLDPRRRRRPAGRPAAGLARARALRGPQLAALVALHRGHPHLPGHRRDAAAGGPCPSTSARPATAPWSATPR